MSLTIMTVTILVPLIVLPKCAGRVHVGVIVGAACLAACNFLCFYCTACGDPGLVMRSGAQETPEWKWNNEAQSYVPPGVQYASEGGCLVRNYDHFCVWTGTLIGGTNMDCFICWACGGIALLAYILVLSVASCR